MKKSGAMVTVIVSLSVSGAALAQSNVTIFGIADTSVHYVNNGNNGSNNVVGMGNGGLAASRFGIRSTEDLGDGMQAGAWLEAPVDIRTGAGNATRFWNRRATVSLSGNFGEVRLGRDLIPGYTAFGEYDTFLTSGLADAGKFESADLGSGIQATGVWARADNLVSYFTPKSLGGFYAHLAIAPSEGDPAKRYSGGRVGYTGQSFDVSSSYSVIAGVSGNYKRLSAAGYYDIGAAKLLASFVKNQYLDASRLISQIGVIVPVGVWKFKASYTVANTIGKQNGVSIGSDDATQIAAGYIYDLSKRTSLYGTIASIRNYGKANFVVTTPPAAVSGQRSRGIEIGISQKF